MRTEYGGRFIALAWATVILMIVNVGLLVVLVLFEKHLPGKGKRDAAGSSLPEHYEMKRSLETNASSMRHEQGRAF